MEHSKKSIWEPFMDIQEILHEHLEELHLWLTESMVFKPSPELAMICLWNFFASMLLYQGGKKILLHYQVSSSSSSL